MMGSGLLAIVLDRHALTPERLIGRDRLFGSVRVFDALADLPGNTIGKRIGCSVVHQQIMEAAQPETVFGLVVELFEEGLTLLGGYSDCLALVAVR